jgi:hypothetical protein
MSKRPLAAISGDGMTSIPGKFPFPTHVVSRLTLRSRRDADHYARWWLRGWTFVLCDKVPRGDSCVRRRRPSSAHGHSCLALRRRTRLEHSRLHLSVPVRAIFVFLARVSLTLGAISFHIDHAASLPYIMEKVRSLSSVGGNGCRGLFSNLSLSLLSFFFFAMADKFQGWRRTRIHDPSDQGGLQFPHARLCPTKVLLLELSILSMTLKC